MLRYYYDNETGFYYLQSRYYDPEVGRFIHADSQLTTGNVSGMNLFAYCGNNPVNRIDLTGEAWWHWAIGAAVVIGCALLTVATAGGFALGATAIGLAVSGISAGGTASIFAAATVSAAMALGTSALIAASNSNSVRDFCAQGNWGTVTGTAFGAVLGGYSEYGMLKAQTLRSNRSQDTFLPDEYYSNKKVPAQSVPNSSYTCYKYNDYTGKYEKSTAYYDLAGRQVIRIDWTNHGYSNHGNPHIHYTTYNFRYRDGITIRRD